MQWQSCNLLLLSSSTTTPKPISLSPSPPPPVAILLCKDLLQQVIVAKIVANIAVAFESY